MKTIISFFQLSLLIVFSFLVLNSCQGDDFVQYPTFLFIDNTNKTDFSSNEILVLKEASQRMSDNIIFEGVKIRITKTAKELNIDQDLFDKWNY